MKGLHKVMLGLTCMGLILVLGTQAQAQLILSIDFSSAQGYSDGTLVGQPAGAAETWTNGVADNPADSFAVSGEAMVITPEAVGSRWVYFTFPVQSSGTLTVTWDWQYVGPADSDVDIGFCVSDTENFNLDGDPDLTYNEQGTMTRMSQSTDVIDARDGDLAGGGSYMALESFPYMDGAKVSMRFEIDLDQQTFDLYAQKEGQAEVLLAQDYGFRRAISSGLNAITLWDTGDATTSSVVVDNIRVFGPSAVPHWELYD